MLLNLCCICLPCSLFLVAYNSLHALFQYCTPVHSSKYRQDTEQGECPSSSEDGFSAPCLLLILKHLYNLFETSRKWSVREVYSCSSSQTDKSLQHCMNAELEQRFGCQDQSDCDHSIIEQSHWDSHEEDQDPSCQSSESKESGSSSNNDDDEDAPQAKK